MKWQPNNVIVPHVSNRSMKKTTEEEKRRMEPRINPPFKPLAYKKQRLGYYNQVNVPSAVLDDIVTRGTQDLLTTFDTEFKTQKRKAQQELAETISDYSNRLQRAGQVKDNIEKLKRELTSTQQREGNAQQQVSTFRQENEKIRSELVELDKNYRALQNTATVTQSEQKLKEQELANLRETYRRIAEEKKQVEEQLRNTQNFANETKRKEDELNQKIKQLTDELKKSTETISVPAYPKIIYTPFETDLNVNQLLHDVPLWGYIFHVFHVLTEKQFHRTDAISYLTNLNKTTSDRWKFDHDFFNGETKKATDRLWTLLQNPLFYEAAKKSGALASMVIHLYDVIRDQFTAYNTALSAIAQSTRARKPPPKSLPKKAEKKQEARDIDDYFNYKIVQYEQPIFFPTIRNEMQEMEAFKKMAKNYVNPVENYWKSVIDVKQR